MPTPIVDDVDMQIDVAKFLQLGAYAPPVATTPLGFLCCYLATVFLERHN